MANESVAALSWWQQAWVRQIVWYALGIGVGAALCLVDYHTLARWSFVAYWAMILCLIVVLIPHIGSMRGGARRWIDLGFFQFQPSEFAKLGFILAAANFLSRPPDELKRPGIFWKGIGLMMLPFALIMSWLLAVFFPTIVTPEGIYGHSVWGNRRFIRWQDIDHVKPFKLLNLRYLRLYSKDQTVTWINLFPANPAQYYGTLRRLAPADAALLRFIPN